MDPNHILKIILSCYNDSKYCATFKKTVSIILIIVSSNLISNIETLLIFSRTVIILMLNAIDEAF